MIVGLTLRKNPKGLSFRPFLICHQLGDKSSDFSLTLAFYEYSIPMMPTLIARSLFAWGRVAGAIAGCFALGLSGRAAPGELPKYTSRVETCEAILREFQADPQLAIPPAVLRQSRALVIVNQVKAGLLLGLRHGYGVVLARQTDGTWSIPVFVRAGEASLGLQAGGQRAETIYVIMDDATTRLLFNGRVNLGADVRAIAGPTIYEAEKVSADLLTAPVLVYGRNHGYYAGATVRTGWLGRDDDANWKYYETPYVLPELIYSDFVKAPPAVQPLVDFVAEITR